MAEAPRTSAVQVRCPACGARFKRPDGAEAGTKIRCPSCNQKIRLGGEGDPRIGTTIAGWTLRKRLGSGSMGSVYLGDREKDGKKVAVKILSRQATKDKELNARFLREARLTTKLRHPNLVATYGSGMVDDRPYMVMELVEGVPLSKVVDKSGALDPVKSTALILQVAKALAYLDDERIVHRDIKPENILIDGRKQAKLADLGFAKILDEKEEDAAAGDFQLTVAGTALGSPAYMAPEQVLDAASATHATDLYCLGASWYHLATGSMPYSGKSAMIVMEKVLHEDAPLPGEIRPGLPGGIAAAISWLMAKEERARPQHAAEVVAVLEQLLENPAEVEVVPGGGKTGGVPLWLIILAVVLLVGAGLGAFFAFAGG
jgi:serine/threonine-protein kinase